MNAESTNFSAAAVVPYSVLVGKVVEEKRRELGMSQGDVARTLGLSQSAYSRLEAGLSAMTLSQLRAVAQCLSCEPSSLLQNADKLATNLDSQGVRVPNEKEVNKAAVLLGLGILALLASR